MIKRINNRHFLLGVGAAVAISVPVTGTIALVTRFLAGILVFYILYQQAVITEPRA